MRDGKNVSLFLLGNSIPLIAGLNNSSGNNIEMLFFKSEKRLNQKRKQINPYGSAKTRNLIFNSICGDEGKQFLKIRTRHSI
jgi:hypothetical protein